MLIPALAPGHDSYRLEKKDAIAQVFNFSFPEKAKTVKIDNVFGSITISGTPTVTARLEARKSLRADSQDDLLKAEREVTLKMAEKDNQFWISMSTGLSAAATVRSTGPTAIIS